MNFYSQKDALVLIRETCVKLGSNPDLIEEYTSINASDTIGLHCHEQHCNPNLMVGIWGLSYLIDSNNKDLFAYVLIAWDSEDDYYGAWTIKCDNWDAFCKRLNQLLNQTGQ